MEVIKLEKSQTMDYQNQRMRSKRNALKVERWGWFLESQIEGQTGVDISKLSPTEREAAIRERQINLAKRHMFE